MADLFDILLAKNLSGGGVQPQGEIEITENGEYDVAEYAMANVNVPSPFPVTVTFMNGETEWAKVGVDGEGKIAEPTVPPLPDGYYFVGWYDGDNQITFPYVPTEDKTLNAEFSRSLILLNPTMTSNTTPRGEVFFTGSYKSVWDGWCAFQNRTDADSKVGSHVELSNYGQFVFANNTSVADSYIGYDFGINETKHIMEVVIYPFFYETQIGKGVTCKIQGSNNGSNWEDISVETKIPSTGYSTTGGYLNKGTLTCNYENAYRYVRIKPTALDDVLLIQGGGHDVYFYQIEIWGY